MRQPESIDSRVSQGKNGLTHPRDASFDGAVPRKGAELLPNSPKRFRGSEWWEQIALRYTGLILNGRNDYQVQQALTELLREHPPVGFTGDNPDEVWALEQFVERLKLKSVETELEAERERLAEAEELRKFGWEKIEQALTDTTLRESLTDGRWAGFTRGESSAWCWNLFQYEPQGFAHPNSQLRSEAMHMLQAGGLPEVFGYPERARVLVSQGLSPRDYRRHREALGELAAPHPAYRTGDSAARSVTTTPN